MKNKASSIRAFGKSKYHNWIATNLTTMIANDFAAQCEAQYRLIREWVHHNDAHTDIVSDGQPAGVAYTISLRAFAEQYERSGGWV